MKARLYRLTALHQRIDEALRAAMKRRWADPLEITRLKTTKLRVKDAIHRFTTRAGTPIPHAG